MAAFPDPEWFYALGRMMETEGERFRRIGYAEVRFALRLLSDEGEGVEDTIGLEFKGYGLACAERLADIDAFDPDFIICGRRQTWRRMIEEIVQNGHPGFRRTLNSLVLVGEELWLESSDQLREDRFYRVNQTLQEFFNLAARLM